MDRQIIFRGKRLDNGQWVYGDLYHRKICGVVSPTIHNIEYTGGSVDPATIGQYTGLTDKNGNKIFEGDILISETIMHEIVWNNEWAKFQAISESIYSPSSLNQEWINMYGKVVIGNIHDNPELLP